MKTSILCATLMTASLSVLANNVSAANLPDKDLQALSAEYMTGTGDMHGVRIAYRPALNYDYDLPWIGDIRLSWEASFNFYDLHGSANTETTYGISVSPIVTKAIDSWSPSYPLALEFGIGVAYVHDEKFGGVDIGSDYQFEDRIGLIVGLNEAQTSEIAIRYIHYSNGGFNTKNPGLDFLSLAYISRF